MQVNLGVKSGFSGRAKVLVLAPDPCGPEVMTDRHGRHRSARFVVDRPWQKNLILDSGLEQLASYVIADCFKYAAAGYGTSAAVVTQTQLDSERNDASDVMAPVRSLLYLTGSGNCGTTHVAGTGTYVYKRTYDFSEQVTPGTYGEVGLSPLSGRNDNLFSRIALAGTVGVAAGQQLRLVYELTHTITPVIPTSLTPVITGWTLTDGDHVLTQLSHNIVGTTGDHGSEGLSCGSFGEPAGTTYFTCALSETADALVNYEAGIVNRISLARKAFTADAYVAGSHQRVHNATFLVGEGNSSAIRAICAGGLVGSSYFPESNGKAWEFLFDSNHEKLNTHKLTITLTKSWNRV